MRSAAALSALGAVLLLTRHAVAEARAAVRGDAEAGAAASGGPSPHCQQVLNSWCNNATNPMLAPCFAAMKRAGATLPLYALRDTDAQRGPAAWRCYSGSSLSPDHSHYTGGKDYCTFDEQLGDAAFECATNATFTTIFPFNDTASGVHGYRIPLLLHVPAAPAGGAAGRTDQPAVSGSALAQHSRATEAAGTLLAFAEARVFSMSDSGPKKLAMRSSSDGGRSWGPMRFLVSDPLGSQSYDGLNLGAAVYDPATRAVTVLYCECAHKCKVAPTYTLTSKDAGATWGMPVNITSSLVAGGVGLFAPGPGTGVAIASGPHAGRLVVAGWWRTADNTDAGSTVLLSDDHGGSWRVGGLVRKTAAHLPNECQVALLGDGQTLLLGMRDEDGHASACHCRLQSTSTDGGATFTAAAEVPQLVDPVCQGSTITSQQPLTGGAAGAGVVYVSNADSPSHRANGTIHVSTDGGATYRLLHTVDPAGYAYSGLALLDANTLGVVYESVAGWAAGGRGARGEAPAQALAPAQAQAVGDSPLNIRFTTRAALPALP